ncbi:hypothetical protein D3C72_2241400 [compost metagenome]
MADPPPVRRVSVDEMQHVPDVEVGVACYRSRIPVPRDDHDLSVVESLLGDVRDSGVPELVQSDAAIQSCLNACQSYCLRYGVWGDRED